MEITEEEMEWELLIAPKGIEIEEIQRMFTACTLLIAPKGIEIIKPYSNLYVNDRTTNRTKRN